MKPLELTDQVFGRLTVLHRTPAPRLSDQISWWMCRCACGTTVPVRGHDLRVGYTKSCGCLQRELLSTRKTTHGGRKTPEYAAWVQLLNRCYNRNDKAFPAYGGRGIVVCDEWRKDFSRFRTDMGPRPNGNSIDRINNDGPYSPANCRWTNRTEQAKNRRSTVWIEWNGERHTQSDWARRLGVTSPIIAKRWRQHRSLAPLHPFGKP
jgi:hypothetical protein